jgi:ribosome-associated heat shock protein Hsp15
MTGLRIDKWLWIARFCKTRGQAQRLVAEGLVTVNGRPVEKSSAVAPGDEIILPLVVHRGGTRGDGRHGVRRLRVLALAERRGPADGARALYEEIIR